MAVGCGELVDIFFGGVKDDKRTMPSRCRPGTRFSAGQEDSGDDVVNSMMMVKIS